MQQPVLVDGRSASSIEEGGNRLSCPSDVLRFEAVLELAVHLWERDPKALAVEAAQAEQLGFASISVGDHVSPGLL
jgi:hypothetical protein